GDAGARDLRSGSRSRQAHRQAGGARGDGSAHRHQSRARPGQGEYRCHGAGSRAREREERQVSGRHHDRAPAGVVARRRDRSERGVLFLRHQRSDADHLRHQPRRRRELSRHLPGARRPAERSLRVRRPRRRGGIDAHRRRTRPQDAAEAQSGHLRRARRRPGLGRILPRDRPRLCLVLAVPCAHRPPRGRPGRARQDGGGRGVTTRPRAAGSDMSEDASGAEAAAPAVSQAQLQKAEAYVEAEEGVVNRLFGWAGRLVTSVAGAMCLLHLYAAVAGAWPFTDFPIIATQPLRYAHVAFVLMLSFLLFPLSARFRDRIRWWDIAAGVMGAAILVYAIEGGEEFTDRATMPTHLDVVLGVVFIILLLEATRRTT